MADDSFFNFDFSSIERQHNEQKQEFLKLLADPCAEFPDVGDTVVFAAGLLGHGFPWIRTEAKCIAVGSTSVKLEWGKRYDSTEPYREWVHFALVTDVIKEVSA